MLIYLNGKFIDKSAASISPDDRGFLFADGVYEVIRSYQGRLFKCMEHLQRLAFGLREIGITGIDTQTLAPISQELLSENGLGQTDAIVYIQVTRGVARRQHHFPPTGTAPTILIETRPFSSPVPKQEAGVNAILVPDERWSRCDIKAIGLLPNVLANQKAMEAGAFEAIFSYDGLLQEGSHSSILFVKDNTLIAPPLTNRILPSITRSIVLSLAGASCIVTEIRPCHEYELLQFDEILMLGTGSEIMPITGVNNYPIADGAVGRITRQLQIAFRRFVAGEETLCA
jgi:D-alanine transaminase